jgi:hypothetical protein
MNCLLTCVASSSAAPETRQRRATTDGPQEERGRPIHQAKGEAKLIDVFAYYWDRVGVRQGLGANVDIDISGYMHTALRGLLKNFRSLFSASLHLATGSFFVISYDLDLGRRLA